MARVARLRDGVELPQLRAGPRIERARVADPADRPRRRVGADHDDVLVDERHRVVRHADIDGAASVPKARSRSPVLALTAIRRRPAVKMMRGGSVAVAGPVRDAAARQRAAGDRMLPELLAGLGIERDDAIRGRQVHHAVDDDRRRLGIHRRRHRPARPARRRSAWACRLIRPGLREARRRSWRRSASAANSRCRRGRGGTSASRTCAGAGRRWSSGRRIARRERPPSFRRRG